MKKNDSAAVTFRHVDSTDEAFLYRLYASARAEELSSWGWDSIQQEAFLSLQFRAQRSHYDQYPNADHQIIVAGECPIGRVFISELGDELRLVDITILPEYRNAGIASALIGELIDRATLTGKAVRLHVEKTNRAQHLYRRLGFEITNDAGSHYLMEWRASEKTIIPKEG